MGSPEKEITRRDFSKLGGIVLGSTLGGAFLGREVAQTQEGKIVTEAGIFYPLYERHDLGIRPEDLLPKMDLFWKEVIWKQGERIINFPVEHTVELIRSILNPQVLAVLAEKRIKIVFGDIAAGEIFPEAKEVEFSLLIGALTAYLTLLGVSHFTKEEKLKIKRRQFLKGALALGGWTTAPWIIAWRKYYLFENRDNPLAIAARKVLGRMYGLLSNFHPEETGIFYRNALWADKLLTVAEKEKERLGRPPHIAYNVGAAHAGVEDFLSLGRDICRWVVTGYPLFFLKEVVEKNGGVKSFSSACLVDLGGDLRQKPPPYELVTDHRLAQALEEKLAA